MFRKIKEAYSSLKPPVKASMWFLVCGFLQKGISMLTTPIFTRVMTDAEYGQYSVYNSWLGIIQIIVSLNLAAGVYTRGLVKNEEDQDRFSSSMLGLSTTCIVVGSIVYLAFHKSINQMLGMTTFLMVAMLVETWAHAAYQFWSNRERVNYRYKRLVALTLTYVILRPVMGVIFVLQADLQNQMEARVIATVAVNAVLFSALYVSIARKGKQFFNKEYWCYALKFNIPLLPHYLSQIVLSQSDRLMISEICGAAETAYYSVAYTLAMVLQVFNTSVSSTMNPWIYKSIKANDVSSIGKVSYRILGVIALLNFAVILAAPELLKLLGPESYQSAVWVIPPVTASVYFMFLYNLFVTFEFYYEKTHYVTVVTVFSAVLNIVLNAVLLPVFGFTAAGYTTLLCYILCAVAHYFFMRKVTKPFMGGDAVYDGRIITALGAALIVGSLLAMLLYGYPVIRYALVLGLAIVCIFKRRYLIRLFYFNKKTGNETDTEVIS